MSAKKLIDEVTDQDPDVLIFNPHDPQDRKLYQYIMWALRSMERWAWSPSYSRPHAKDADTASGVSDRVKTHLVEKDSQIQIKSEWALKDMTFEPASLNFRFLFSKEAGDQDLAFSGDILGFEKKNLLVYTTAQGLHSKWVDQGYVLGI